MTKPTAAANAVGLPEILQAMESSRVRSIDTTPEAMLEELNERYERSFQIYRAGLDLELIDDVPIARSIELAADHAVRVMGEVRTWASLIAPSTVRGFALKARLFTDCEPSEWLDIKENHQIVSLLGQLLNAAGLAPIASFGDQSAEKLIENASKGEAFNYRGSQRGD